MYPLKVLSVFGTRPEAIKMAPVIRALSCRKEIDSRVCITGQHQKMLTSVLELFDIVPDYDLKVMRNQQNLSDLSSRILSGLSALFTDYFPDLVVVHGDTSTTFITALAAFYHKISVAHVEAGLRTGNLSSPWPEEANRKLTATLGALHFAPTQSARRNLLKEGINADTIFVTGNTVIDTLNGAIRYIEADSELRQSFVDRFSFLQSDRKYILVTGHRRENFGHGFEQICAALLAIAKAYSDIDIVYPVHLNPSVQNPVKKYLANQSNIYLIDPVDYLPFVFLMQQSYLILTDSGGIQEEAPSLGKPVLVMRDHSERMEAIDAGTVKLVGTDANTIVAEVSALLNNFQTYKQMSSAKNPYGDGQASQRIVECIINAFHRSPTEGFLPLELEEETGIA